MIRRLLVLFLGAAFFSTTFSSASIAQDDKAEDKLSSECLLPASTKAWFSVPDYARMCSQFKKTEFGQLTEDELLKPFIESLQGQIRDWLNNQNVRLGVKVEDLRSVRTGEICIAGVLQDVAGEEQDDSKLGRGSHGLVLLVDVSETEDKARALMDKVDAEFKAGEAALKLSEIHGMKVTKWTVQRPKLVVKQRSTFHTIAGGWLLISDNEKICREIIRRLVNVKQVNKAETLASQIAFQQVAKNTNANETPADFRWFVDPFGYLELAQAIEKEDQPRKIRKNDWARILKEEGFHVLHGIGGQVSFATEEHEMLHQSFVYAPRKVSGANQKRFFGLFDFENRYGHSLTPEDWIPEDISAHVTTSWDMSGALENVGGLVDSFMEEEGAWENIVAGLKADMNVDVTKMVASFENQITVITSTARPITANSERVAICLPINKEEKGFLEVIKSALGGELAFEGIKILGQEVLLVEPIEEELEGGEFELFEDPDAADDEEDDEHGDDSEEFELFQKKYFAVVHQHLIIANNKELMKKIIQGKPKSIVANAADYQGIRAALDKLTDAEKTSSRHFGRVDRSLETNYEMLRQGKMGLSNTMLARVLNRIFKSNSEVMPENDEPRVQKLDGSKLPDDYEKFVAKYLGPMGWVMESDTDGWRVTGCVLKKKQMSEVVQKPLTRR